MHVGHLPSSLGLANLRHSRTHPRNGHEHATRLRRGRFAVLSSCTFTLPLKPARKGGWLPMWKNIVGTWLLYERLQTKILTPFEFRNEYHDWHTCRLAGLRSSREGLWSHLRCRSCIRRRSQGRRCSSCKRRDITVRICAIIAFVRLRLKVVHRYFDREENVGYEVRAGLSSAYDSKGWVANDVHSEAASRTLDYSC